METANWGRQVGRSKASEDYYLENHKVLENKKKIVFEFPIFCEMLLEDNKEYLLSTFREVEKEYSIDRPNFYKVICYKK